jgi:hypothetical protein
MQSTVVEDLSLIAGVEVETTWDSRLGVPPFRCGHTVCVESPTDEARVFRRLAASCDATLVIAPEIQGILTERCRVVEDVGGRLLGPSSRAVALCSDKLRLAAHLRDAGIETISTRLVEWDRRRSSSPQDGLPEFPIVVKPRDGAGSQNMFLVNDADELARLGADLASRPAHEIIEQPYVAGTAVSVALVIASSGREIEVFVPARQFLSDDGRFRYLGGQIPIERDDRQTIQRTALAVCRSVPELRGYVGVDLIVLADAPDRPIVVEINPRLTTSYLGYRRLAEDNLAEWMLFPDRFERPIRWRAGLVAFDSAGRSLAPWAPCNCEPVEFMNDRAASPPV